MLYVLLSIVFLVVIYVLFSYFQEFSKRFSSEVNRLIDDGNTLFAEKRIEEAIQRYTQILTVDPNLPLVWSNLGTAYLEYGLYQKAEDSFREALHLSPTTANYKYNLAVAIQNQNRLSEAAELYAEILKENSTFIKAHYNLGLAFQELGRSSDALKSYSQVLKLNPSHIDARLNTCNILMARDQLTIAERCYHDVLKVDSNHVRGLVNLASFYHFMHMTHDDISVTEDAPIIKNAGNDFVKDALALLEKALAIDPTNKVALQLMKTMSPSDDSSMTEMDPIYVQQLFDSYSYHFDDSLSKLNYSTPALLAEAIALLSGEPLRYDVIEVLDLGAGTGLACEPIKRAVAVRECRERDRCENVKVEMEGVDLSANMLQHAAKRECYSKLTTAELVTFLENQRLAFDHLRSSDEKTSGYDYIIAADVLVYICDLLPIFQAARAVVRHRGLLLFTVEAWAPQQVEEISSYDGLMDRTKEKNCTLTPSGRFAHSKSYIHRCATVTGWTVLQLESHVLRYNKGNPVTGFVVVCSPS